MKDFDGETARGVEVERPRPVELPGPVRPEPAFDQASMDLIDGLAAVLEEADVEAAGVADRARLPEVVQREYKPGAVDQDGEGVVGSPEESAKAENRSRRTLASSGRPGP